MSLLLRDKRIQLAFAIAVVEWFLVGGLVILSEQQRWLMGAILFVGTAFQMGLLFWRPRPTGLLPDAQLAFMEGDYVSAQEKLETLLQTEPQNLQALTLLGNTYRQQSDLTRSAQTLEAALEAHPQNHFPLYGLGRTRLAQGFFEEAAQLMEQALAQGGRKATLADLALAYYFADQSEQASQLAQKASRILQMEAHRILMVNYLLYHLKQDQLALPMMQRHQNALSYWQTEANRFAETAYGQRLTVELSLLQPLLERDTK